MRDMTALDGSVRLLFVTQKSFTSAKRGHKKEIASNTTYADYSYVDGYIYPNGGSADHDGASTAISEERKHGAHSASPGCESFDERSHVPTTLSAWKAFGAYLGREGNGRGGTSSSTNGWRRQKAERRIHRKGKEECFKQLLPLNHLNVNPHSRFTQGSPL